MNLILKIKKFFLRNILPFFLIGFHIKDRYLFSSFYGLYNDSPKVISESLHKKKPDADIFWIYDPNKEKSEFPDYVKKVKINSIKATILLWTSRYLIDNCQKQLTRKLNSRQIYIQTWHGTPLKKIEFDATDKLPKHYLTYSRFDNMSISCLLIGNEYSEDIYKTAFKVPEERYRRVGIPRNDVFFQEKRQTDKNAKRKFGFLKDDEPFIVLYAPTFRNSLYNSADNENVYGQLSQLNPTKVVHTLEEKLGRKVIIVTHFHPNVVNKIEMDGIARLYRGNVIDGTVEYSIDELLQVSDMLITDYSSVFFDFSLSGKPIILFDYDYDSYMQERGTYVDIDTLPLISAKTSEELSSVLKNNTMDDISKRSMLLNQYVHSFERGNATKAVTDILIEK